MAPDPPARRHRLVATDLDGTLLHSDGTVTARTRRALSAVEELGITVVFVTGRPIRWMDDLRDHVGAHGLAICSNGGVVYDVHEDRVSRTRPIATDLGLEVARLVRSAIPDTAFAVETHHGIAKEPGFMERNPVPPGTRVAPITEILDEPAVKLLARHEELDPEDFWTRVEREVGHLVTTTWSSLGALVEISAAGVTKASTLELLCAERGIGPHDVVAFGDMPNDLPMLEWAGTSYAMANAHPSVRKLADHVAPAHDEDGVASVLESLFDLPRRM
jgi:Cof subfamily protein (haloacid dehalogenase superfamily)